MSEPADWPALIGMMIILKSDIDRADPDHLQDYDLPRIRAVESELLDIEGNLDIVLPSCYREFLLHANGWSAFYWNTDLFGTVEFNGGGAAQVAWESIDIFESEAVLGDVGLSASQVVPIGAGIGSENLFLLVRPTVPDLGGNVVWISGGDSVEVYRDFVDFFSYMIEMHQIILDELHAKHGIINGADDDD
ncbi:SMI1/KNR4 family protein [Nocardia sp. NPDC052566]|uniref:SMI1/KNR4 family protein n=1 Tax=Nocardia sp. NPDC052566 TaxID=3364330 RepID=UPI0037CA455E